MLEADAVSFQLLLNDYSFLTPCLYLFVLLVDRFGFGGFELTFDGEVVASYTSFGDQLSIQLGDGCDNL